MSFALLINSGIFLTFPISSSILRHASLAPPWAGPHKHAIPEAIQAKGFAPDDPASLTVEVDAFAHDQRVV